MIARWVVSKLATPPFPPGPAPGHRETSNEIVGSTCAKRPSSSADSRTLSRRATGLNTLKMVKSSFAFVVLRRPPRGPSGLMPAKPARAKNIAGPEPGTIGGPPLVASVPRSTSGRSPPAPVRTKTEIG
jgi:hypothetical protein